MDRPTTLVRAVVTGWAPDAARAARIASLVHLRVSDDTVRASFPGRSGEASSVADISDASDIGAGAPYWSVSYRVSVPRHSDMMVVTNNGGIRVDSVLGRINLRSHNGALTLGNVGGNVHGHTNNGALMITLTGPSWTGAGLDVDTNNGGVVLRVPSEYAAQLEAGTNWGTLHADRLLNVQGSIDRDRRHLVSTLGTGGALIRVSTNNGSVSVQQDRAR